jgi:tetratricopeptide (TPR) repeat protein
MAVRQEIQIAIKHQQAGRLGEAEEIYRRVLAESPNEPDALQLLVMLLAETGRSEEGLEILNRAIATHPEAPEFHNALGEMLRKSRRWDDAIAGFQHALRLRPGYAEACSNMGIALWCKGQLKEAIDAWSLAVQWKPNFAQAHNNLGNALKETGRVNDAIAAYSQALRIKPDFVEAHLNLGNALQETGKFESAVEAYMTALKLNPSLAEAYNNLGNALRESGRLDEAAASIRRAIELKPAMAEAHNNLGNVLKSKCEFEAAIVAYEQAIKVNPRLSEAHVNLAQTLLLRGDFARGWGEYEWRWALKAPLSPALRGPRWDGRELGGQTILLHAEGGFGDAIQFVRYVPLVVRRGGRVVLQCRKELKRLLEKMQGVESFHSLGEPLSPFDTHCPLLSLPLVFGSNLENIPADVPYLGAINRRSLEGSGRHIGLAWAGTLDNRDARNRHISIKELSALSQIDATFHSLQVGPAAGQFRESPELKLVDHSGELKDFTDTAALIDALDLIITVDTSVAHLAGAMGKPVWVMLSLVPEWRWLLDREDSPWYPTARLFRQKSAGDWAGVVERVAEALRQ